MFVVIEIRGVVTKTSNTSVVACIAGLTKNVNGVLKASCTQCLRGTYKEIVGSYEACTDCPPGTTGNIYAATSPDQCYWKGINNVNGKYIIYLYEHAYRVSLIQQWYV